MWWHFWHLQTKSVGKPSIDGDKISGSGRITVLLKTQTEEIDSAKTPFGNIQDRAAAKVWGMLVVLYRNRLSSFKRNVAAVK